MLELSLGSASCMRRCWKWDLLNLIGCWERGIKVGVFVWWDNYKEGEVVASYIANDKCLLISRRGHSEEGGREVCRVVTSVEATILIYLWLA